jgi:hypothetical protein
MLIPRFLGLFTKNKSNDSLSSSPKIQAATDFLGKNTGIPALNGTCPMGK